MKNFKKMVGRPFVALAVLAGVSSSASAAIETTAITAALTEAGTAAATVGAAVLIVFVGIKAFKMIKAAL